MKEQAMVLDSARQHLSSLKPLAKKLNEATNEFTEELRTIETELVETGIGITFTLDYPLEITEMLEDVVDGEAAPPKCTAWYLSFGRHEKAWKLLVRVYKEWDEDGERKSILIRERPLLEASRTMRMAAAGQIDDLLKQIATEGRAKLETLRKAIDGK